MEYEEALALFETSTTEMFTGGRPLMSRVLRNDTGVADSWAHYPAGDVVNGPLKARWFYHCHAPEERGPGEHGHFHLFVGKNAFGPDVSALTPAPPTDEKRAEVVHIAALSIDMRGLPTGWFTINRWVTDEWLYPSASLIDILPAVDFRGPKGDALINDWLTAIVALQRRVIADILRQRDQLITKHTIDPEDRDLEVLSSAPLELADLLT